MAQRIALFNFPPSFCPGCGSIIYILSFDAAKDFFAHASHTCIHCGVKFQYAKSEDMLELATKDGDMKDHMED